MHDRCGLRLGKGLWPTTHYCATETHSNGTIPNDIQLLEVDTLASLPTADLITAGWECQGDSRAGHGKGLRDHRSALFFDLVRVIALCQAKNIPAVGYLLENVNISDDTIDNVVMDRGSHAFRNRGPGMVQHTEIGEWREPVPVERQRAMGFPEGYTQVVGISDSQRQEMLGGAMDPHTLQFMLLGL